MNIEKQKKILEVAKYIIQKKATIAVTAEKFNLSISCIKKYINDKENLQSIDIELYQQVKLIEQENIKIGNTVGGRNGIRPRTITDFEAMEIAEEMIIHNMTLDQAERKYHVARSTIYENIKKIKDEEIQKKLTTLFENNSTINKEKSFAR